MTTLLGSDCYVGESCVALLLPCWGLNVMLVNVVYYCDYLVGVLLSCW